MDEKYLLLTSCGLAILLDPRELETVKSLKETGKNVDYLWLFEKTQDRGNVVTEININE